MTDEEHAAEDVAIQDTIKALFDRLQARAPELIAAEGQEHDPEAQAIASASFLARMCIDLAGDKMSHAVRAIGHTVGDLIADNFCCPAHAIKEAGMVATLALDFAMQHGPQRGEAMHAANDATKH